MCGRGAGQLQSAYPELLTCTSYSITSVSHAAEDAWDVMVAVATSEVSTSNFVFRMVRKAFGRQKGCFMTKSLLRV